MDPFVKIPIFLIFSIKKTRFFQNGLLKRQNGLFRVFSVEFNPFFIRFVFRGDSTLRAFGNANATFNAGVGVDNALRIRFGNRADGANVDAGQAFHAGIVDNRSHFKSPQTGLYDVKKYRQF